MSFVKKGKGVSVRETDWLSKKVKVFDRKLAKSLQS
jgi:hypothetical protein